MRSNPSILKSFQNTGGVASHQIINSSELRIQGIQSLHNLHCKKEKKQLLLSTIYEHTQVLGSEFTRNQN